MITRHRLIRNEYRTDEPPKDGSTIVVPCRMELAVYWDEELQDWVLVTPKTIDTLGRNAEIMKWKRPR